MGELPSRAAFQAALNQRFTAGPFAGPEGAPLPVELTLVEVAALPHGTHPESFSLRFRGPANPMLQQGVYPLRSEGLGALELFVTPVTRDPAFTDYEAIFNRG